MVNHSASREDIFKPNEQRQQAISLKRSLGSFPVFHSPQRKEIQDSEIVFTNKLLGKGSNSEVYLAYDNKTLAKLAVKVIDLKQVSANSRRKLDMEIEILTKLKNTPFHHRFVKIERVERKTEKKKELLHIALEFIPGCDLFTLCSEYSLGVPESMTRQLFRSICISINELHNLQICHLDLKLENIMYDKESNSVKIIDFGFSQYTTANRESTDENSPQIMQSTFCGSIHYAAPELLNRQPFDGKKADVWSLGVVLFALLAGHFPFDDYHGSANKIFYKIRNDSVEYPLHFTNQQIDLLFHMLDKDAQKRYSIADVLNHPYCRSC